MLSAVPLHMPIPSGTRIGAYEVVAAVGAGGMGEVSRARDTRLGREVAAAASPVVLVVNWPATLRK